MNETIIDFNIDKHLETGEDVRQFLRETASTGEPSDFIYALSIAARAKGMTEIAKQAGVTRTSLYKSLSEDGNPRFDTIAKVVDALGCKLIVS